MNAMRCDMAIDSGAYVLGVLERAERIEYERHLATCEICQAEVADFAGLPGLLSTLDRDTAESIMFEVDGPPPAPLRVVQPPPRSAEPPTGVGSDSRGFESPPSLRAVPPLPTAPRTDPTDQLPTRTSRVQRGADRRYRRWRTVTAALAAAACLMVGILVGGKFFADGGTPGTPGPSAVVALPMRPVAASTPITAEVALKPFIGGTQIQMHCVYHGSGGGGPRWTLKLFVHPKAGAPEQVSTWTAGDGDDLNLTAVTRFAQEDIAKIELRKGDDQPLLEYRQI